jgi:hypothetical protein
MKVDGAIHALWPMAFPTSHEAQFLGMPKKSVVKVCRQRGHFSVVITRPYMEF